MQTLKPYHDHDNIMLTLTALLLSGLGLAPGGGGNPLILPDCEGVGEWGVLPLLCNPCLLSELPP